MACVAVKVLNGTTNPFSLQYGEWKCGNGMNILRTTHSQFTLYWSRPEYEGVESYNAIVYVVMRKPQSSSTWELIASTTSQAVSIAYSDEYSYGADFAVLAVCDHGIILYFEIPFSRSTSFKME